MANPTSQVLTFRGRVYVGNIDPFDPNDPNADKNVVSNSLRDLGIIEKFTIEPTTERVKIQEWSTGNDTTAESWPRVTGGKIKMLSDHANPDNLALNMAGRVITVGPESVTGAKIAYKDPITKKYKELTDTTVLKSSVGYYFAKTIAGDGLSYEPYDLIDTATFVLSDSSATPKTLTVNTDYTINGVTGKLVLKGTAGNGVNLAGLTYPLTANFNMGLFVDTIPNPFVNDKPYPLSQKNISNVTMIDSSATPKVISDLNYDIDSEYGMLTITNKAAILATVGLTLPIKIKGTQGVTKNIGLMSGGLIEKQIRVNGLNARTGQKMVITLYKVSFDTQPVDFFDKDYTKTPLEGELLSDPSKPDDGPLGQFGKIEYL